MTLLVWKLVKKIATRLDLEHTGVPDAEAADFDAGWDDYYLGPMKELLEGRAA